MSYLEPLYNLFETNKSTEAEGMEKYMKNLFPFLGIKRPVRNELQKQFLKENGLPEINVFNDVIKELWSKPEREYQYFALDLMEKMKNKVPHNTIELYQHTIIKKSWWDTVDLIASKLVGNHILRYPEDLRLIDKWSTDDNMWLRRTSILHQLKYKTKTDTNRLKAYIENNLGSQEFFINKAIGWALREYGKTNTDFVLSFVKSHPELSNLSKKEALRIILKK